MPNNHYVDVGLLLNTKDSISQQLSGGN
jgi:hypothetical protein